MLFIPLPTHRLPEASSNFIVTPLPALAPAASPQQQPSLSSFNSDQIEGRNSRAPSPLHTSPNQSVVVSLSSPAEEAKRVSASLSSHDCEFCKRKQSQQVVAKSQKTQSQEPYQYTRFSTLNRLIEWLRDSLWVRPVF